MPDRDIHETPRGGRPQTDHELLLLLTERLGQMSKQLTDIAQHLGGLDEKYDQRYVSREEFWPVKTIVYGGAAIVLIAVVGALVAVVIRSDAGRAEAEQIPPAHTRIAGDSR
jgi:hypothetical protein